MKILPQPKICETGAWCYTENNRDDSQFFCKNTAEIIYNTVGSNTNLIDIGCGTGYYLEYINSINQKNLHLIGVEPLIDKNTPLYYNNIKHYDLTKPFDISPGNVMCIEVLEHIPKIYEDIAVKNVVNSCNEYLFLSWAKVGQGGHGHVNCKNKEDVINLFESYNFILQKDITETLCNSASKNLWWLRNNLCCFKKDR